MVCQRIQVSNYTLTDALNKHSDFVKK